MGEDLSPVPVKSWLAIADPAPGIGFTKTVWPAVVSFSDTGRGDGHPVLVLHALFRHSDDHRVNPFPRRPTGHDP